MGRGGEVEFTLGKDWRLIFIENKEVAKEKKEKIRSAWMEH
jgi:hypothetical protein